MAKNLNKILVAVPHNSGTTYLASIIANYIKPDIPYFHLADGFDGCDHTLSINKLEYAKSRNLSFVAPLHVRNSPSLQKACQAYQVQTIVMTRSIYDVIISLKDRIRRYEHKSVDSSAIVFAKTIPAHSKLSDEQLELFLIRYAAPWYFSFYASWYNNQTSTTRFLRYEELIDQPVLVLKKALDHLGLNFDQNQADSAVNAAKNSNTRLNKGISGRGNDLRIKYSKDMAELSNLYPSINFEPLLNP